MNEQCKINLYDDMTPEEVDLVYYHKGNYKDWICQFTGCGKLMFLYRGENGYKSPITACRSLKTENWVPECWKECKEKIDKIESL